MTVQDTTVVVEPPPEIRVTVAEAAGPTGPQGGDAASVPGMADGDATLTRVEVVSSVSTVTGRLVLAYLVGGSDDSITTLRMISAAATAAGSTVNRLGLYLEESNGDLTLIGSTAHDATLGTVANTVYDVPLSAPVARVIGQRYAIGRLIVSGAAVGSMAGTILNNAVVGTFAPRITGVLNSQSDLPSSIAAGSLVAAGNVPYFEARP